MPALLIVISVKGNNPCDKFRIVIGSFLVCFSAGAIKHLLKATWGGKGLFGLKVTADH